MDSVKPSYHLPENNFQSQSLIRDENTTYKGIRLLRVLRIWQKQVKLQEPGSKITPETIPALTAQQPVSPEDCRTQKDLLKGCDTLELHERKLKGCQLLDSLPPSRSVTFYLENTEWDQKAEKIRSKESSPRTESSFSYDFCISMLCFLRVHAQVKQNSPELGHNTLFVNK